ncbi:hypothetical protein [Planctomonas deserti]|uniref:hypothetical protein n=1 Tax=Planctomonas deserti TaxID=2144185 RepID=UPI000D3B1383|nr:hypothetical protein [Planctomonas deserti]
MITSSAQFLATRAVLAMCAVTVVVGISGCAADSAGSTTGAGAPAPTPAPVSTAPIVTDVETCEAFTDVSTILLNGTVALREGRMTQREFNGWMRLATRVLDRVPTRGEGAVSEAVAALKAAAPPIPSGSDGATSIGDAEWNATATSPAAACDAAGYQLFAEGFTGG